MLKILFTANILLTFVSILSNTALKINLVWLTYYALRYIIVPLFVAMRTITRIAK